MRALDRWLLPYLRQSSAAMGPARRVFVTVADHFEPFHQADRQRATQRMADWREKFPKSIAGLSDSAGREPRHTFFYPVEQYERDVVAEVAALCHETGSETEVHLHHDNDTEATLRSKLETGVAQLVSHGLLSKHADGRAAYAFVHGDWALANSGPDGQCCGVPHEIDVLLNSGCYADFTFPSAPNPSQPRRVNSMYYVDDTGLPTTLDHGRGVRLGEAAASEQLLIVQGVLALNWYRRKWGVLPRIENSDLTGGNPPTPERFRLWLRHAPRVAGLDDWAFVKLHSHGAVEANSQVFLGNQMRSFHRYLCEDWATQSGNALHYVTAREMVNVLRAVEAGAREFVPSMLNFLYPPPAISL